MRIVIPTIGTRGDIQIYMALARALERDGHEVTVATHPCWKRLVEEYSLGFAPVGPPVDIEREAAMLRAITRSRTAVMLRSLKSLTAISLGAMADLLRLFRNADLVVLSHNFIGRPEAEKTGVPFASVTLQYQFLPRRTGGTPPGPLQRLLNAIAGPIMYYHHNRVRGKLGMGPVRGVDDLVSPALNMIPISPSVVRPDPSWEGHHRLTGYWFLDEPRRWRPPAGLVRFLESGDRPVAVSLGAMSLGAEEGDRERACAVISALEKTGTRAVIQGWNAILPRMSLPRRVFHAGDVPHSWLFRRAAAVVHHGGFGTTASALRAGVPSCVVPHMLDQFSWALRVSGMGVGCAIPATKLTAGRLVEALDRLKTDRDMAVRARSLGARIAREDGLGAAVRLIRDMIAGARAGERPVRSRIQRAR